MNLTQNLPDKKPHVVSPFPATFAKARSLMICAALILSATPALAQVKPGIDVLASRGFDILQGKRVGLITNPTGVTAGLRSTVDVLEQARGVELVALFGPEHGVRGNIFAGKKVDHFTDKKTGLPVYSLYGKTHKPTPEMLADIDVLVYDIQDAGYRPYTYIYTMGYAMQAAAEQGLAFVVLDRPNPLGADRLEGPILEEKYFSGIGRYAIPYLYGLTVGELAQFVNAEYGYGADLTVVPMQGYRRDMLFEDTGLQWVATSPHVPHARSALFAAAVGTIGELHTVSVGIGYTAPFELVGEVWIDPDELAREMNARNLPGVYFRPAWFRHYYHRSKDSEVGGVQIHLLDARLVSPQRVQLHLIDALRKLYPEHDILNATPARMSMFLKAMGTDRVHKALQAGTPPDSIIASWQKDLDAFDAVRKKYLIYP